MKRNNLVIGSQVNITTPLNSVNKSNRLNRKFNLLDLIRTKYIQVIKMIPISNNIGTSLALPLRLNSYLSFGKLRGLAARVKYTQSFISFVLKLFNNHGAAFTIKWLKACSVAVQKFLGDDRLVTLRTLDPDLPLPRLTNGLPRYISVSDRAAIRNGDVRVIRFHLGLLNLYRVLEAPGVIKINTITDPFSGSQEYLEMIIRFLQTGSFLFFDLLPGFSKIPAMSLSPEKFVLSRSASPSNKMSAQGIITDVMLLNENRPDLWQDMLDYLYLVKPKMTRFVSLLQDAYSLGSELRKRREFIGLSSGRTFGSNFGDQIKTKASVALHGPGPGLGLSQFAIKREAAGKIRLFALLDSITQSILSPLHNGMFALLRLIPNDGTFDQEASIKRSMTKALNANCAFSFDLTAATDRLPVILTSIIIEEIWKFKGISKLWTSIMTNRDFSFNNKVAEKLGVSEGPYRYAVGQPMGGLSSWPGLALTHHWIVQFAAYQAHLEKTGSSGNVSWCENYEILGDDLVIFDPLVAEKYLIIMTGIGCEINLNKSINSPNKPVFEFAKRTCIGNNIVSGISMNQVRAGWNVGARVANALSFSQNGLLTSANMLATVLSRYASAKLTLKELGLPVLAVLGSLFQQGKLTHRLLAHTITDPSNEDFDYEEETVGLPIRGALNLSFNILNGIDSSEYPYSREEDREEIFKEYRSEFSTVLLQKALAKATRLYEDQDSLLANGARELYRGFSSTGYHGQEHLMDASLEDMPSDVRILTMRIENFFNHLIDQDNAKLNPETLHDEIYDTLYKHAKWNHVKFEDAMALYDKVENLEFKYTLREPEKPGKTVLETTPIISVMRNMVNFNKVKAIIGPLDFRPVQYERTYDKK